MPRCSAKTLKGLTCRNKCLPGGATCTVHTDQCFICFKKTNDMEKISCGHEIHRECLETWIKSCRLTYRVPDCPMCRARIATVVDLDDVRFNIVASSTVGIRYTITIHAHADIPEESVATSIRDVGRFMTHAEIEV